MYLSQPIYLIIQNQMEKYNSPITYAHSRDFKLHFFP
jgi:hypothetical protein